MKYVFHSRVTKVERKRRAVRVMPNPLGDPVVDYEDLGWFLHIDPFAASISVGDAEPEWKPGQLVKMTIEDES